MKTHKSMIAEALQFFGPLNVDQIVEKLAARENPLTRQQVEAALYSWNPGHIVPASGFDVPTYRVTSMDAARRLEY